MVVEIPFLSKCVKKGLLKREDVADSIDFVSYYVTTLLFVFFALLTSGKQYFGSPIQCFFPGEFDKSWLEYAHSICFINSLYDAPFNLYDVPKIRKDTFSYYRWVPVFLAFQAISFYCPTYIWSRLQKATIAAPEVILKDIQLCAAARGEDRKEKINAIAEYIVDILDEFSLRKKSWMSNGFYASFLYLGLKLAHLVNCFGQLWIMGIFIGDGFHFWGLTSAWNLITGTAQPDSKMFPRVTFCDFKIRTVGNIQNFTIQCVIMMNMINEKIFLFFYFWLIFVGIITGISFIYHVIFFYCHCLQKSFIKTLTSKSRLQNNPKIVNRFVRDYLCPDGMLLFKFIYQHGSAKTTAEILDKVYELYGTNLVGTFEPAITCQPPKPNHETQSETYQKRRVFVSAKIYEGELQMASSF